MKKQFIAGTMAAVLALSGVVYTPIKSYAESNETLIEMSENEVVVKSNEYLTVTRDLYSGYYNVYSSINGRLRSSGGSYVTLLDDGSKYLIRSKVDDTIKIGTYDGMKFEIQSIEGDVIKNSECSSVDIGEDFFTIYTSQYSYKFQFIGDWDHIPNLTIFKDGTKIELPGRCYYSGGAGNEIVKYSSPFEEPTTKPVTSETETTTEEDILETNPLEVTTQENATDGKIQYYKVEIAFEQDNSNNLYMEMDDRTDKEGNTITYYGIVHIGTNCPVSSKVKKYVEREYGEYNDINFFQYIGYHTDIQIGKKKYIYRTLDSGATYENRVEGYAVSAYLNTDSLKGYLGVEGSNGLYGSKTELASDLDVTNTYFVTKSVSRVAIAENTTAENTASNETITKTAEVNAEETTTEPSVTETETTSIVTEPTSDEKITTKAEETTEPVTTNEEPMTTPDVTTVAGETTAIIPTTGVETETVTTTMGNVKTLSQVKGVKVKAAKKKLKVSWKKIVGVKYEVQYSTSKSFKSAVTKTVKKVNTVFSKLKAKKKYFVRVRAVAQSKTGKWSKTISKKTK